MRLSDLKTGDSAIIVKILGHGAFRKRVMEMGFVRGREITSLLNAPLRDPVKYGLMGYEVSLRRSEANMIEVVPLGDYTPDEPSTPHTLTVDNEPGARADSAVGGSTNRTQSLDQPHGADSAQSAEQQTPTRSGVEDDECDDDSPQARADRHRHIINVALIGNPNCGKTSIFNVASGASEHVGNYSGVTVDCKYGTFRHAGYTFRLVDLPGTYSLTSYSPEELYVRRYLQDNNPDVILNVVDASNLERNLYLTTELIDMDHPMVIALNLYDELRASGNKLDYKMLGSMIGVPVVPTVSRTGEGIDTLFDKIIEVFEDRCHEVRHVHVNLDSDIEAAINSVKTLIKADRSIDQHFSPRYLAIKLLEGDTEAERAIASAADRDEIIRRRDAVVAKIEADRQEDLSTIIANEKYGFISGALAETLVRNKEERVSRTHIIDSFVTNRLFGFPIFLAIMFFIFWMTFYVGQFPMGWIEDGCRALGDLVQEHMADGPLKDLIADGIIGGVGGVIVFLPNILILYFFISFMEDSGYMARAAFIMDKLMHKIGLHGKSFIPLVMGFGCNVPAVMACRTIESRSSRLITILINPFISCSARLPLYVLLIGTFFEAHAALVFLLVYLLGIFVAVLTAKLLRRFVFKVDETPFVMELPPYRIPTLKSSLRHMWWKGQQYLRKMGGVILIASIVVWALNYFPLHNDTKIIDAEPTLAEAQALGTHHGASVTSKIDENSREVTKGDERVAARLTDSSAMTKIDEEGAANRPYDDSAIDPSRDSYLQMLGKAINPVFEPLGFTWRTSVAVIAGIPAKEIVVSTLGVLYAGDEEVSDATLSHRLTAPSPYTGIPDFNAANALSLIVFILLYCPCIATITAIVRETHSWRYGAFAMVYNTVVAWVCAFIVYRLAIIFGAG